VVGWREPERRDRVLIAQMRSAETPRAARSRLGPVLVVLACLALLAGPVQRTGAAEANGPPGYRFGVFPYLPALTIDRIFGPIAASFAAELGQPVYLKTRSNFEKFSEDLNRRVYDIIFVHPFFYVQAAHRSDYLPLARLEGQLSAVAVVRSERPWRTWSDLAGRSVALPPDLAAVSELAKIALVDAGLIPGIDTTLRHYRTKASCVQAVSIGAADACVLPRFVLPQIKAIGDGKLRIMAESPSTNHLVFAMHPRVPDLERKKLLALILSWPDTEQGRAILAAGSWPRFVTAHDSDYAQVRNYNTRLRMLVQR
jgi:phosphonate transport system substrate-binding protein